MPTTERGWQVGYGSCAQGVPMTPAQRRVRLAQVLDVQPRLADPE